MKKLSGVFLKGMIFFAGWAVCVGFLPLPNVSEPAVWRFWAEMIPFITIVLFTLLFYLVEKSNVGLSLINRPLRDIGIGFVSGSLWLGGTILIFLLSGVMTIHGIQQISLPGVWIISVFINTMMQELLVRGYLYQMIKQNYNFIAAGIVTTGLFTILHGGAVEAGVIPVLNVLTMSLFMTAVLEYTQSLLVPIIIHFIWNAAGSVILGGVSLAEDYPHLLHTSFQGNPIFSGGVLKMEGSVIVLVLNILFTVVVYLMKEKRKISACPR